MIGGPAVVRARIRGVFCTYKIVRGERRAYWYHRATGNRLRGNPGSPEFIRDLAAAEALGLARHAGTFNGLERLHSVGRIYREAGHDHADRIPPHADWRRI